MVPNVNARGTSFKGVTAYLMHDKEKAQTSERVEWTTTRNMVTDNIETASKIMAFTDTNSEDIKRDFSGSAAGAKREVGAVYHFSLSESPERKPTQEEWEKYVDENIKVLGLEDHQYYMVSHNDEPHAHVHVVVNLVHPETGLVKSPYNDYKKMDKLAHEYELENGIVCEERDKKYKAWEQEQKAFKEKERREEYAAKVTLAFEQSDNSQSFKSALEHEGLTLAQGNRRGFVLVDGQGQIFALNRLISFDEGIKRKEKNQQINDKLEGIDKAALPVADKLQEQRQTINREAEEVKKQNTLLDAADKYGEELAKEKEVEEARDKKLIQEQRNSIYEQSKLDWKELNQRQRQEKSDLWKEIKDTRELDKLREKGHTAHWNEVIIEQTKKQNILQHNLAKEGLAGVYFRFRHGKETRLEIENINKNIADAEIRKDGVLIVKKSDDYAEINKLHSQQREDLKIRLSQEIQKLSDDTKQERKAELDAMERDAGILLEREKIGEQHSNISVSNDFENVRGGKMPDPRTSREKWEDLALSERFEDLAARAQQQNKNIDKIIEQDEAKRQELENASKVTVEPISNEQIDEDLEALNELENEPKIIPETEQNYWSGNDQNEGWFKGQDNDIGEEQNYWSGNDQNEGWFKDHSQSNEQDQSDDNDMGQDLE